MTTPAIYNIGQLRAYLQGRLKAIEGSVADTVMRDTINVGRADAYNEAIIMIDGILAYDASRAAVSHGSVVGAQTIDDESGYAVGSVDSLRP